MATTTSRWARAGDRWFHGNESGGGAAAQAGCAPSPGGSGATASGGGGPPAQSLRTTAAETMTADLVGMTNGAVQVQVSSIL